MDYNWAFINIRGQLSEKVVGKNHNIHFPLSFHETSLYKGTVGIGEGEISEGSADVLFPLGVRGGRAERGVSQLLHKLTLLVPVFALHLY